MKKTQKRLGNKGFSLVELIVVIAIMAVLVGVLALTVHTHDLLEGAAGAGTILTGIYGDC